MGEDTRSLNDDAELPAAIKRRVRTGGRTNAQGAGTLTTTADPAQEVATARILSGRVWASSGKQPSQQ
jgi:hypothetical protein